MIVFFAIILLDIFTTKIFYAVIKDAHSKV
ncbi:hypothetical protein BAR153v2_007900 [Bartonella sp. AR 15-3]|nr:hypothetical protein BAR153v2_007900 [Bartonella sp. AR 15-3]